jgi:biopolymer transport protein ExbD
VNFRKPRRADPAVDLTPLIDIIFQLVLFFMVSTSFTQAQVEGIEIELPKSSTQVILTEKAELRLKVAADGAVYLDDAPMTLSALRARLRDAAKADPSTLVVIRADASVGHGRVVAVMDLARAQGLSNLAIATEANTAGGSGGAPAPSAGDAPAAP